MKKNIVIVSTKGGVGKSTIADHVITHILEKNRLDFQLVEIDNNNSTTSVFSESQFFSKMKSIKIDDSTAELENLVVENMTSELITVIDAGGGDDSKKIINMVVDHGLIEDTLFVIPYMPDFAQVANLIATYKLLEEKNCKILVLANGVDTANTNDMMFVSGNEELELENFKKLFGLFAIVEKSHMFSYATMCKKTLHDISRDAFEFNQNEILDYAKKQTGSDKEKMLKIYRNWKVAKMAKDYLLNFNLAKLEEIIKTA